MEENMPVVAKKVWHIVRFALFMLRKGISKKKFLLDLNLTMKRAKLARKALGNLMFNHRTTSHGVSHLAATTALREFEFSCSNTPLYSHYLPYKRKQNNQKQQQMMMSTISFSCFSDYEDMIDNYPKDMESVNKVLDHMMVASPTQPGLGFWQSPLPVGQFKIMDTPYSGWDFMLDDHVDEAADEFIKNFHSELKKQLELEKL